MAVFAGNVVIDPAAVHRLLSGPSGPVYRRLLEDGEIVKREARQRVGVHKPDPWGRPKNRRPGQLRDSIVKRMVHHGNDVAVQVGSDDPIALPHHEGTEPHVISGRAGKLLVFWMNGAVVASTSVNHPGTEPNHYLTDAVDVLRRRY